MDEQPHVGAVADFPQAALAAGLALVVDLAGVLDEQDVAPGRDLASAPRRRFDDLGGRHLGIAEKSAKGDQFGASASQPAKLGCEARAKSLQYLAPLF